MKVTPSICPGLSKEVGGTITKCYETMVQDMNLNEKKNK